MDLCCDIFFSLFFLLFKTFTSQMPILSRQIRTMIFMWFHVFIQEHGVYYVWWTFQNVFKTMIENKVVTSKTTHKITLPN